MTGDRELSPFSSLLVGVRVTYAHHAREQGRILGFMTGLQARRSRRRDPIRYDEYTLGGVPVTNARAYILGANLSAGSPLLREPPRDCDRPGVNRSF